jgi:hypothetical protein
LPGASSTFATCPYFPKSALSSRWLTLLLMFFTRSSVGDRSIVFSPAVLLSPEASRASASTEIPDEASHSLVCAIRCVSPCASRTDNEAPPSVSRISRFSRP